MAVLKKLTYPKKLNVFGPAKPHEFFQDLLSDIIDVIGKVISTLIGLLRDVVLGVADAMNKEITIPVLSALYEKISKSPLTLLDLVCLLMAIPATIGYKLIKSESPMKLPGIEYLTKPNIYVSDLRQRLQKTPPPIHKQQAKLEMQTTTNLEASTALQVHFYTQMKSSTLDWNDKIREAQLHKDVTVVDQLITYGVPLASLLWFNFYTIPSWYKPDTGPNKDDIAFMADLFIWAAQYTRVGAGDVPGARWRFATWMGGFLAVYANECATKPARAGFRFWCGALQLITSIGNYVTLFQNDIDVDIYSMVEDFVILVGDMAASAADYQYGANIYVTAGAFIMKNAGFIMRVAYTDRHGYTSGMTIKT